MLLAWLAWVAATLLHYVVSNSTLTDIVFFTIVTAEGVLLGFGIIVGRSHPLKLIRIQLANGNLRLNQDDIERIISHDSISRLWKIEFASTMIAALLTIGLFEYCAFGPYPLLVGFLVYFLWIFWWAKRMSQVCRNAISHFQVAQQVDENT